MNASNNMTLPAEGRFFIMLELNLGFLRSSFFLELGFILHYKSLRDNI